MDAIIDRALNDRRLVGAVVFIARDGNVVYRRAAGLADREARRPMREDAIFLLSSVTKPIVTAMALALVDRGTIAFDDEIARWLPEFRPRTGDGAAATITVRQLLSHTAGLNYGFLQPAGSPYELARVSDGLADPGLDMGEQLRRLESVPLTFAPGASWGYSVGIDVLGAALERATGVSLPQLVEEIITQPLRMRDTGFVIRDRARLAVPYVDAMPPRRMTDPDRVPFIDMAGIRYAPSRIDDPRSFPSGGAGMAGTAGDVLTLLETIRQGGAPILGQDSARAMMSNQIGAMRIDVEPTPAWGFGFGGAVLMDPELAGVPQSVGTWKWGGVYGHSWFVDPVRRLTVVALTNTAIEGMNGAFQTELVNAVYDMP